MQSSISPRRRLPQATFIDSGGTMVPIRIAVATTLLWAACAAAQGPDPAIARSVAAGCSGCHGTNGASMGVVPSLAGMPRAEIILKTQEFKSGKRQGTIMPQLAKGYTDDQIDLAATWFALQPAQAK
jgi:cytochrome subunit of sulfide dehydrogenase